MEVELKCRTLIDLFNQLPARPELAQKDCLEIARVQRAEKLTFGELKNKATGFCAYLTYSRGIRRGDNVAILGRNRVDWDVAFWGTILAGAIPVLIDPERRVEGVKKHLLGTDSRLLVMADDYQDENLRRQLRKISAYHEIGLVDMTVFDTPSVDDIQFATLLARIRAEVKSDDTAVILCTSGTTGEPRGVELTHTNLIANIQGLLEEIHVTSADKLGHITPPHHSFGLTVGKLLPFWIGATNIYTNKYREIDALISQKGITFFVAIPALYTTLARKIESGLCRRKQKSRFVRLADRFFPKLVGRMLAKKLGWRKLRFFVSGAAPLPKWVLDVFWKRGMRLREGYGLTESSPVYGLNDNPDKLSSVGRPLAVMSVKIVNEKGRVLEPGQKGEILLGGPCITKGYYKNEKATEAVIRADEQGVRWLHTGDLGHLDEDGYLYITGRKKYLIVLPGGKNVSPEMLESVLSQAECVDELLVVPAYQRDAAGVDKEVVKAIVRPDWDRIEAEAGLSRRELENQPEAVKDFVWQGINRCQQTNQELAGFEKIQSKNLVKIQIAEFAKTSTGKIKRDTYIETF
ncbi:MAG TPA: acyl--CoA ligase [Planctomycetes bacterium]|nr:acyl--CoA ligase [Planctomycetota bacterium]HIJ71340.1 acyl--CoA ligase [Planctomycetota bacterium]